MEFLHPANAEELANIAEETGAEVLRGSLRYPSETGSWQLGDTDLGEHLERYRDCELVLVIAATSRAEEDRTVCGICGFALSGIGGCPRCKLINERRARDIEAEQEAMFREVKRILRGEDE